MTGREFGRLTVLSEGEPRITHGSGTRTQVVHRYMNCRCSCGTEKLVSLDQLRNRHTTSCGCLRREATAAFNTQTKTTHGLKKHELYRTWTNIRYRCRSDPDYAGRGITVWGPWNESAARFITDVEAEIGPRPSGQHPGGRALYSLERLNNDGNYEPGNIDWRDDKGQRANQRPRPRNHRPAVPLPANLPPVVPTPPELKKHPLYATWRMILYRCENPASPDFPRWGAEGVRVCARWHEFALFLEDVLSSIGPRPPGFTQGAKRKRPLYTLNRVDNSGNYESGNVEWADAYAQRHNQRPRLRSRDLS